MPFRHIPRDPTVPESPLNGEDAPTSRVVTWPILPPTTTKKPEIVWRLFNFQNRNLADIGAQSWSCLVGITLQTDRWMDRTEDDDATQLLQLARLLMQQLFLAN